MARVPQPGIAVLLQAVATPPYGWVAVWQVSREDELVPKALELISNSAK